ncbi:MAG: PE-PGRS family protein, partial [Candidatus Kapabacteria bacterium]|nr:PE-PGRS family protein [Candidatus Kapabacteria bacterium]
GKSYIYIGDIGDNNAIRANIKIIEIEEPKIQNFDTSIITDLQHKRNIFFKYPDGAKDAESLLIDPISMDLFVISKREGFSRVFSSKYPFIDDFNELEHIATLPFNTATGADISSDGKEILVRNYIRVYYWQRNGREHLKYTFQQNPQCLPLISEPKGESICFAYNNSGYYTVSEVQGYERLNVTMNYYKRK